MPYVTREQIETAKQMDLLTYLHTYEPAELMRISSNVYTTRSHNSLKISNGKWCWWSRGIGGRSALDYLMKIREMALPDAVNLINGQATATPPAHSRNIMGNESRTLLLPDRYENNNRAISYLLGRGIDRSIIEFCIQTGRLYESQEHHNAVFIGFDQQGVPRYGMLRGTGRSRFVGDVVGSNKKYSFSIPARQESRSLHLFESAIDLLSFGTMEMLEGRDWRRDSFLSLAGVYKPKEDVSKSNLPPALTQFLNVNPRIDTAILHLDNDLAGQVAAKMIQTALSSMYTVVSYPPKCGKDVNDCLRMKLGMVKPKNKIDYELMT